MAGTREHWGDVEDGGDDLILPRGRCWSVLTWTEKKGERMRWVEEEEDGEDLTWRDEKDVPHMRVRRDEDRGER